MANRTGLFIANSVDYLTGWADDNRTIFLGATAAGLIRGAVYGLLATIFIAAIIPLHAAAIPLLLTLVTIGAAGYGVYDGQKALEKHVIQDNHRFTDTIAEKTGAVPTHTLHVTTSPEETLKASGRDPSFEKRVDAPANAASFTAREDARRCEVLPVER
jgi:hypothetical protein